MRSLYESLVMKKATSDLEWYTAGEIAFNKNVEMRKQGKSPGLFAQAEQKFQVAITDMAVFAAGALMEKASIEFYENAAIESKSDDAKKLFNILVGWEKQHLDELSTIHEALMKEWMDKQEFTHSPKL